MFKLKAKDFACSIEMCWKSVKLCKISAQVVYLLNVIAKKGLKKLPMTYTFGVVATRDDQKQTHLATELERQTIMQRMNWRTTMTNLAAPYSGH